MLKNVNGSWKKFVFLTVAKTKTVSNTIEIELQIF